MTRATVGGPAEAQPGGAWSGCPLLPKLGTCSGSQGWVTPPSARQIAGGPSASPPASLQTSTQTLPHPTPAASFLGAEPKPLSLGSWDTLVGYSVVEGRVTKSCLSLMLPGSAVRVALRVKGWGGERQVAQVAGVSEASMPLGCDRYHEGVGAGGREALPRSLGLVRKAG